MKIFNISRIKKIDDIINPVYQKEIYQPIKQFLSELNNLIHGIKEIVWNSIDEYFINKLSNYIFEATENMFDEMSDRIAKDKALQIKIKQYLRNQDIFNVSVNFDNNDIYNLCQLANYLLFLKIIFYSYLQREVPKLKLKKLEIPEDNQLLNKALRNRFDEVLEHDFEQIFEKSVLDDFEFSGNYLSSLKRNVEEINKLNFKDINADIIGSIYNTLIDNQEQHARGQHFTNIDEVDMVCGFCIKKDSHFILDSGCGAGTFLVRAYQFLKYYHPEFNHQELLERLWGIDIAPFPVFLAMMNLSLLDISCEENYPTIIQKDFSEVKSSSRFKIINLDITHELEIKQINKKLKSVKIPLFDNCIGNPPYIRQENIENKDVWMGLSKKEFGIKKINRQSDLYVYYLMHSSAFLKEKCRMGYVISSSWLDVNFGAGLQKFLLDNFKIIAIIDNQKTRSFATASINTVILIIEKCSDSKERDNNKVRFIRVQKKYEDFIGKNNDDDRLKNVLKFVSEIESSNSDLINGDYQIIVKKQSELKNDSTFDDKYENGHWGARYLRAPEIYYKILKHAKNKFVPLKNICDIVYGIKTGANDFFYLTDDTEELKKMSDKETLDLLGEKIINRDKFFSKFGWYYSDLMKRHYKIERQFIKPLFKTQKEAKNLDVDFDKLKYVVLICNHTKKKLKNFKYKVLDYILDAEQHEEAPQYNPSCESRKSEEKGRDWYMLGNDIPIGDFIFPSKIGEKFRLIDNRKSMVYTDKVNYNILVRSNYKEYSSLIFLYLNSITFRFFIDLFSRQLTGNQTISDVDVNLLEKTLILKPELLAEKKYELKTIFDSIKNREQVTIYDEVNQSDKRKLDEIIFGTLGLSSEDVNELYSESCKYVKDRQVKSESIKTSKSKNKLNHSDALKFIKERFDDIRKYDVLIHSMVCKEFRSYNLKVKFPPNYKSHTDNFFDEKLYVYFIEDNSKRYPLIFDNVWQVMLFEFLVRTIEIKEMIINIPVKSEDAKEVLLALKEDYENNIGLIKSLLKTNRINISEKSIYKTLIFEKSNNNTNSLFQ